MEKEAREMINEKTENEKRIQQQKADRAARRQRLVEKATEQLLAQQDRNLAKQEGRVIPKIPVE